jgi:hypothetical protein
MAVAATMPLVLCFGCALNMTSNRFVAIGQGFEIQPNW